MLGTGTASLMTLDTIFKTNTPLLSEMVENYNHYKANGLTRGQYDYQRQKLLYKLRTKLGPANRLLNGTRTPNEILRISRIKGVVPTEPIARQIGKMTRLAKSASRGGVILTITDLASL